MKTDKYTKFILTVIAINLTLLSIDRIALISEANAANDPATKIMAPINENGTIDVNIKSINTSDVLDVNIDELGGFSTYGALEVKLKNQPVKVEIEDQPVKVKID